MKKFLRITCLLIVLAASLPRVAVAECTCDEDGIIHSDKAKALQFKLAGLFSVLIAGSIGVSLPLLGKRIPALAPESDVFFMIKAFAAGVILATAMIHILPDAFKDLTSPCLSQKPWRDFPFAGFVAMMAAIGNLMVDSMATAYFKRAHFKKVIAGDEEKATSGGIAEAEHAGHVHVHTHGTHGHAHGSAALVVADGSAGPSPLHEHSSSSSAATSDLIRHRIVSQVLELGIVVHSVIIGVSLGAAVNIETIKSLLAALSFHQFFEGMGLGSCISQANFKNRSVMIMAIFFSLTTPAGIAIGVGVANVYRDNSPTTLIVQGMFNAASAGILIYMALVDILAADFMNQRMQTSLRLQFGSYISLLLGAGCMSSLAKWA